MVSVCQSVINLKMPVLGFVLSLFAYAVIFFNVRKDLQKEAVKHSTNDVRYLETYRTKRSHLIGLKYVLLWTHGRSNYLPFKKGQTSFIEHKCPQVDCYFTDNRKLFRGSLKKFDALMFNGVHLDETDLPMIRYDHQKYIYINLESAGNFPICKSVFENFFNWTYTYKLNSDILFTYFEIRNKIDEVVGPKLNMEWIETDLDNKTLNTLNKTWQQKSLPVVWMVSRCKALNKRENLAQQIQYSLNNAKLSLATYGKCGELPCPIQMTPECWKVFERNYYFYLSFENSNCEDYVTEKVLFPLQHYLIPIVYGGAKYSRFLPRHSYLDASKLSPDKLVSKMKKIMSSFAEYSKYFKWRSEYRYTDSMRNNVCALCSALHNRTMMDTRKSYKQLRRWWHPYFRKECTRVLELKDEMSMKKK